VAVHDAYTAELDELASAFALEALLPEEAESYLRHLEGCDLCRRLVVECQAAADLLPLALEEETGSSDLKQRIMSQAALELDQPETPRRVRDQENPRWGIRWPDWLSPNAAKVAAAFAVVTVGLVLWNVTLQINNGSTSELTATQLNLIETIGSGAAVIELKGTEAALDASAQLVQAADGNIAFLILRDLPLLASGEEFEIWSIGEGVPISVGTFAKETGREQLVSFSADFSDAQNIGISIEPENGSPTGQPTGPIVLLGPV